MATNYAPQNREFCDFGHAMDMTIVSSREGGGRLNYDASSLDSFIEGGLLSSVSWPSPHNISRGFCRGTQSQIDSESGISGPRSLLGWDSDDESQ